MANSNSAPGSRPPPSQVREISALAPLLSGYAHPKLCWPQSFLVVNQEKESRFQRNSYDKNSGYISQHVFCACANTYPATFREGYISHLSAGPKRGCLTVGAWNPQESGKKAPLSMLQCSFSLATAQLLVKWLPHCRKANVAVQLLQRNFPKTAARDFCFRLWHLAGVGNFRWGAV